MRCGSAALTASMPRQRKIPLTLVHNEGAGGGRHDRSALLDLLRRAGYAVTCFSSKPRGIDAAIGRPAELIVAAGGDGTVARVAAAARPEGPPIAILPCGTANNLAKALGGWRPLEELVSRWRTASTRPFYPIDAEGPWGSRRVIEGIGFGAVEDAIADLPDKTDRERACLSYADAVTHANPELLEIRLDEETISDRFPLLEVVTIPLVGPNLPLAPGADPSDRKFEICFIRDRSDEREAMAGWLADPDNGISAPVSVRSAGRASITGQFRRIRIDGTVTSTTPERDWDYTRPITLSFPAKPLRFLVPG
jgi:diacylglycerol kinase family enzyme